MLAIEDALKALEVIEGRRTTETIPLLDSLGRITAAPVRSRVDHPPFDKSAMDGYAVAGDDPDREWTVQETLAAGGTPRKPVTRGTCSKIMTGAMLPPGADTVVMVEDTETEGDRVRLIRGEIRKGDHICPRGEDARAGALVAEAGRRITPQLMGSLAACGHDRVEVFTLPRLAVLTTGDEIVLPGKELRPGQIYNSNGFSLYGQYRAMGMEVRFGGGAPDTLAGLKERIGTLLRDHDVLVISGGVSMGDFDFVPRAVEELGGRVHFDKVAVKPGKPTLFATLGEKLIFGLPGNPVSTFIITEILVKPALNRLMNCVEPPLETVGRLAAQVSRRKTERTEFRPVHCCGDRVEPVEYHGSAHLLALPRANGLIRIERGVARLDAGSEVRVRLL